MRKYRLRLRTRRAEPEILEQLHTELLLESSMDLYYIILIIASCAIATFGLLSNSTAVIIGAMLVAVGTFTAIVIAFGLGVLVRLPSYGSEVLARSAPTLLDLGIAVVAGGISGYAKVEPKISGTVAGTAIAVALMPPICVIGLGLAQGNLSLGLGATLLYLTNLLGISLSCMTVFVFLGYTSITQARKPLTWTLVLTTILLVPLSASFVRLVRQAQLEASLKRALLNRTITFQRSQLLDSSTNWLVNPPEVRLSVRAKEPVTPKQVFLLQEFIKKEMGQPFTLIFEVGQVEEIRSKEPE